MQYATITTMQCEIWEGLEDEVQADEELKRIVQDLLGDFNSHSWYQLKKGRPYKDRIVIPRNLPRISWILHELHNSAIGGHSGFFRTYKRVAALVLGGNEEANPGVCTSL